MQNRGIEFHTVTCLNWNQMIKEKKRKEIIINSFQYLVNTEKVYLYGFVIMDNHIHYIWEVRENFLEKNIKQNFLKYTAQQIKFDMNTTELELYISTQKDRQYHFWERRSWIAALPNRYVVEQKLDYIHFNPVKAGLVKYEEDYPYSSSRFYRNEGNEFDFLTHYMDRI